MAALATSGVVAVVALIFGVARPAHACSCDYPLAGVLAPTEGETVPRNARIWLGHVAREADYVELRDLDLDEVIAVERSEIGLSNRLTTTVLSPLELLEPGEYAVESPPYPSTVFEVVDEIDTTPPVLPTLVRVEPAVNDDEADSCGTYRGVMLELEAKGVVLAFGAEHDEPDEGPPAGQVLAATTVTGAGTLFGFDTPCGGNAWPGGKRFEVRFGSFDTAGNFSGLSDPETIERPDDTSCSVALGRPRNKDTLALLALLAITLVERRRRARRSQNAHS